MRVCGMPAEIAVKLVKNTNISTWFVCAETVLDLTEILILMGGCLSQTRASIGDVKLVLAYWRYIDGVLLLYSVI